MANSLNIPKEEIKKIAAGYKTQSAGSELFAYSYIAQQAKNLSVDKDLT